MKIAIIGYSGSGKSTLASIISQHYKIKVLHIDSINFNPNWQEKSYEEVYKSYKDFLSAHPNDWIIDGNYLKLDFDKRMAEADKIIFLNINRITCYRSAKKRYLQNKDKIREGSSPGCFDNFDFDFKMWILFKGRTLKRKNRTYYKTIKKYKDKVIVAKSFQETNNILKALNIVPLK